MKILDIQNLSGSQASVSQKNPAQLNSIIVQAVRVLREGGLIIFPTETTYGAGVDATNQQAVDKLLAYKTRREGKPLSIAVTDLTMAQQYVEVNESAQKIYDQFLPGPVTVVSKSLSEGDDEGGNDGQKTRGSEMPSDKLAKGVVSEFGTLGVRIPDYPLILKIVRTLGRPITATSANASGKKKPYSIHDLFTHLSKKQKSLIDLVLDAGTLPPNPPSVVIDTTFSTPVTMRSGTLEKTILQTTQNTNIGESIANDTFQQIELISSNETETKEVAGRLLLKYWNAIKETGLIIGLDGPLGAGKTIFAKGVAKFLQISEPITSPTYTYMNEYDFKRHGVQGKLYHLDLWKINSAEELARLELAKLLQPNTVVAIEWWSQISPLAATLRKSTAAMSTIPIIVATIEETNKNQNQRIIQIHD